MGSPSPKSGGYRNCARPCAVHIQRRGSLDQEYPRRDKHLEWDNKIAGGIIHGDRPLVIDTTAVRSHKDTIFYGEGANSNPYLSRVNKPLCSVHYVSLIKEPPSPAVLGDSTAVPIPERKPGAL